MGEAKHFVLVHGGAHGAWCWYKIVNLLQKAGHKASAVDLACGGIDNTDPRTITSPQQLAAPLISLLEALPDSDKVILVLHSMGGVSGTIAMELFPEKIAVSVFLAALMLPDPKHERAGELVQIMVKLFTELGNGVTYGFDNGADQPPTSMAVAKSHTFDVFYHLSPPEDAVLANMCLKPFPVYKEIADFLVPQTTERYGSVPRVYIACVEDHISKQELVDVMCQVQPPKQLLSIYSDHSPFFSAPSHLLDQLLEIAATFT